MHNDRMIKREYRLIENYEAQNIAFDRQYQLVQRAYIRTYVI